MTKSDDTDRPDDDPRAKMAAMIAALDDDDQSSDGDRDDSSGASSDDADPPRRRRWRPSVHDELPRLVLERALGRSLPRRLRRKVPLAVVVQAPSADWVVPLSLAAKSLKGAPEVIHRDGAKRQIDRPDVGNDEVAAALRQGNSVVGVSQAPDRLLPATLTAVVDARVAAVAPDGDAIRILLRRCLGSAPKSVPDDIASGLDFHDIVSAFRRGATPRRVVALLAAVSSARCKATAADDTPTLDKLPGCAPAAREWGLALARDYAAWRRREIPWKQVDAAAVLTGIPGGGKTTFAKSLARTLKVRLVATSVGEWFAGSPGYLDSVIKAAQQAFDAARSANGILFIDELDAIPNRNTMSNRGKDWWTPVITYLLLLFDSEQTSRDGMVLLGATNADISQLDPALVRPGRFGRQFVLPPPTALDLSQVLAFWLGSVPAGIDLEALARLRPGATPADAAQWARDARALAIGAGRAVTADDIVAAVAPPDGKSDRDRRVAALHEAGHAVVAVLGGRALMSVSIAGVGTTAGATTTRNAFSSFPTRAEIEAETRVLMAGRAAEIVFLGVASMGAEGDLMVATRLVAMLHTAGGLGADLLHRAPSEDPTGPLAFDPALRRAVADDLARIQAGVIEDVRRQSAAVDALAGALMARRFLDGPEAEAIVKRALAAPARRGAPKPGRTP